MCVKHCPYTYLVVAAPTSAWCALRHPIHDRTFAGVAFPPGRSQGDIAVAPNGPHGDSAYPLLLEAAVLPHSCRMIQRPLAQPMYGV